MVSKYWDEQRKRIIRKFKANMENEKKNGNMALANEYMLRIQRLLKKNG